MNIVSQCNLEWGELIIWSPLFTVLVVPINYNISPVDFLQQNVCSPMKRKSLKQTSHKRTKITSPYTVLPIGCVNNILKYHPLSIFIGKTQNNIGQYFCRSKASSAPQPLQLCAIINGPNIKHPQWLQHLAFPKLPEELPNNFQKMFPFENLRSLSLKLFLQTDYLLFKWISPSLHHLYDLSLFFKSDVGVTYTLQQLPENITCLTLESDPPLPLFQLASPNNEPHVFERLITLDFLMVSGNFNHSIGHHAIRLPVNVTRCVLVVKDDLVNAQFMETLQLRTLDIEFDLSLTM
jgi:hypothetical protein